MLVVAIVAFVVLANFLTSSRNANGIQSSPNWSGYVWPNSRPVQFVSAQVTVPTLNCRATPNARSSAWVGVGGFGADSVWPFPQAGINMDCFHGTQVNFTWCSHSSISEDFVGEGDAVTELVYQKNGDWFCRIHDLTSNSNQVHKMNYFYRGTVSTSEWIVEDPTLSLKHMTLAKLADFRTVAFDELKLGPGKLELGTENSDHDIQIEGSSGRVEAKPEWFGTELKVKFG
jgi:hypothetical protein